LDPRKALATLTDEFQKHRLQEGQFLIQDAINRILLVGELDTESKKAVSGAIEVLTRVKPPGQPAMAARTAFGPFPSIAFSWTCI
jgi:hypothetical protein